MIRVQNAHASGAKLSKRHRQTGSGLQLLDLGLSAGVQDGAHLQLINSASFWIMTTRSCPKAFGNCQKSAATSTIFPSQAILSSLIIPKLNPWSWLLSLGAASSACGFPPESQKSSVYPSECLSHKCVCLSLYFNPVTTAWPLVLPRDQLCCLFSQDLIPFALFPHPKINSNLSLPPLFSVFQANNSWLRKSQIEGNC